MTSSDSRCRYSASVPARSRIAAGRLATATGRHIHLVLENGDNLASLLDAAQEPPRGKYRGQWNDDYHHAWHVLFTREAQGYYGDYQRSPRADLARALASGKKYISLQQVIPPFSISAAARRVPS